MGVPASEVGYTPAMSRREDHQVHKDMWWHWGKKQLVTNHCTERSTNSKRALIQDVPGGKVNNILGGHSIGHSRQFVSCIHFFLHTSLFIKPHKQKYNGVKSGDLGGQLLLLPRPIHLLGKVSFRCCITCRV